MSNFNQLLVLCVVLNANMRRIDLCCKLFAPALTGVILQHAGPFATTVIVAIWNVVSFFGELGLLWIVYKLVPSLSIKKVRDSVITHEDKKVQDEESSKVLLSHIVQVGIAFCYVGTHSDGLYQC